MELPTGRWVELAGELGFEPRSSVLETDSLTVELTPLWERSGPSFAAQALPCLLRFLVIGVLAARVAELGELETARGGLLVLGGGVVPVLANRALQGDDLAHDVLLKFGQPHRLASSLAGWT